MKLEIKNPVLRLLAGCGLLTGFWVVGWLINFIPGYYEWLYWKIIPPIPFDLVVLGFLTALVFIIIVILLVAFLHVAEKIGSHFFSPKI